MKTPLIRRRGFTLIELLVVIAVIVILIALSAGTYFRIYANEYVRATNATATKLNTALDRKITVVNDSAAEDARNGSIPAVVMNFAGGDKDRARTIWTYLKLKNELPTTFAEAKGEVCPNPTQLAGGDTRRGTWIWWPRTTATPAIYIDQLKPLSIFTTQLGLIADTTGTPEQQSAACLYLALTAAGGRGNVTEGDGLGTQIGDAQIPGTTLKAYIDGWGTPIAFSRMSFGPEVNSSDYVRANAVAVSQSRDPCDPAGSLIKTNSGWTIPPTSDDKLNAFWARAVSNHISYANLLATYPNTLALTQNWVPTVISAGPNKQWDGLFAADSDNIISYRLRREGNRGD